MDVQDLLARIESERDVAERWADYDEYWRGYTDGLNDILRWVSAKAYVENHQ